AGHHSDEHRQEIRRHARTERQAQLATLCVEATARARDRVKLRLLARQEQLDAPIEPFRFGALDVVLARDAADPGITEVAEESAQRLLLEHDRRVGEDYDLAARPLEPGVQSGGLAGPSGKRNRAYRALPCSLGTL